MPTSCTPTAAPLAWGSILGFLMGLILCVPVKSQELQGFKGFPRLSSGDNPSPRAVCEGTRRSCSGGRSQPLGQCQLQHSLPFQVWRGSSGCRAGTSCSALVWESSECAKKDSLLQDSPSAAGPWDLRAVTASTAEPCGCDLLQEAAGEGSGQWNKGQGSAHGTLILVQEVSEARGAVTVPSTSLRPSGITHPRLGAAPRARNAPSRRTVPLAMRHHRHSQADSSLNVLIR